MRPPRGSSRSSLHVTTLLACVGLWAVALFSPVLELADHPVFLVAHDVAPLGGAVFGVGLLLGPPVLLAGVSVALDRRDRRWSSAELTVAVLAGLAAIGVVGGLGLSIVTLATALGTSVAVQRYRWHRWLSWTVVFAFFLLSVWFGPSPVGAYVRSLGPPTADAAVLADPAPVVVMVFDELPAHALLTSDLVVNRERFPAFGEIAARSTVFRLASSVSPQTEDSFPALLSGVTPRPGRAPVAENYLTSILNLFANSHDVFAFEAFTRLCDGDNCAFEPAPSGGLRLLVEDTAIFLADAILPFYRNEAIRRAWSHWWDPRRRAESTSDRGGAIDVERGEWSAGTERARLRRFLATMGTTDRVGLFVLHLLLPHQPWVLGSDGSSYGPIAFPGTAGGAVWPRDEGTRMAAWQRLQMQLVATDGMLGEAIAQMKTTGLWDDAIVVVTADHGLSLEPGPQRQPGTASLEVTAVPLFIKQPHQRNGRISDRPALTIDIAPTLVALQGGDPVDLGFDGIDILGSHVPVRRANAYATGGRRLTPIQDARALAELVALRGQWISPDGGVAELFRFGPAGALVGTSSPGPRPSLTGVTARLPESLARRRAGGFRTVGVIDVHGYDGDAVLIEIGGLVAGAAVRIGSSEFYTALDPNFASAHGPVSVLTPDGRRIRQ